MSIFDGYSGFDSTDWLREKSLVTLKIAASLVDLANETDTTPWYAKNLKGIANGLMHASDQWWLYFTVWGKNVQPRRVGKILAKEAHLRWLNVAKNGKLKILTNFLIT